MTRRQLLHLAAIVVWFCLSMAGLLWSMVVMNNVIVYFLFDVSMVHSMWHFAFYYNWYKKWLPRMSGQ